MEIILAQNLKHLGEIGQVVKVKDGYARNYLLPKKLAYKATKENLKRIEAETKALREKYEQDVKAAQEVAEVLGKASCTVSVEVNDQEKLYGAVTAGEIVKALEIDGHAVDRKQVVFEKPIEDLGIFEVGIVIHPDVTAKVRVWVTKK